MFSVRDRFYIGSLSHTLDMQCHGFTELPDFPEEAPDCTVRNVVEEKPAADAHKPAVRTLSSFPFLFLLFPPPRQHLSRLLYSFLSSILPSIRFAPSPILPATHRQSFYDDDKDDSDDSDSESGSSDSESGSGSGSGGSSGSESDSESESESDSYEGASDSDSSTDAKPAAKPAAGGASKAVAKAKKESSSESDSDEYGS
jgi:AP-3 complex subunit beta